MKTIQLAIIMIMFGVCACKNYDLISDPDANPETKSHILKASAVAVSIDGTFSDWDGIPSFTFGAEPSLTALREIKVAADSLYIYVYAKIDAELLSGNLSTFIDTDMDATNGFTKGYAGYGAELLSQSNIHKRNGSLDLFTGAPGTDNWSWRKIPALELYQWSENIATGDAVEFEFSLRRDMLQGLRNDYIGLSFFLETAQWTSEGLVTGPDRKPIVLNLITGNVVSLTDNIIEDYQEDYAIFANPERGWYVHRSWTNAQGSVLTAYDLTKQRNNGISQIFMLYYFSDFMNKPLSAEMLALIQHNFDALRESGMKAVLRFAYSKKKTDAPLERMVEHIEQLAPVLKKNVDVIAVVEAGFIGAYGEWYDTSNFGNSKNPDFPARRKLINALLSALPKERMISMRTPIYKTEMLETDLHHPLVLAEAYNQTPKARLSHHNDCFLANATDMGTYKTPECYTFTAADSKYTCVGGETCQPSSYSECIQAIEAMEKYHWSYLNIDYHKDIINDWEVKGCLNEIQRRLGYRFVLKSTAHPASIAPGEKFEVKITIENVGFAAPYNPRACKLIFRSKAKDIVYQHEIKTDPRFWFGGEVVNISETIQLPSHITAGVYDVLLSLYDPQPSISSRAEYAIRLANQNVWEAATGYNKLFRQTIH